MAPALACIYFVKFFFCMAFVFFVSRCLALSVGVLIPFCPIRRRKHILWTRIRFAFVRNLYGAFVYLRNCINILWFEFNFSFILQLFIHVLFSSGSCLTIRCALWAMNQFFPHLAFRMTFDIFPAPFIIITDWHLTFLSSSKTLKIFIFAFCFVFCCWCFYGFSFQFHCFQHVAELKWSESLLGIKMIIIIIIETQSRIYRSKVFRKRCKSIDPIIIIILLSCFFSLSWPFFSPGHKSSRVVRIAYMWPP